MFQWEHRLTSRHMSLFPKDSVLLSDVRLCLKIRLSKKRKKKTKS